MLDRLKSNLADLEKYHETCAKVLRDVLAFVADLEAQGLTPVVRVELSNVAIAIDLDTPSTRDPEPPLVVDPATEPSPVPLSALPLDPDPDPELSRPFVSGAFSAKERATIDRMLKEGKPGGEIASALHRKPKALSVSLVKFRKELATRDEKPPAPSTQKTEAAKPKEGTKPPSERDNAMSYKERSIDAYLDRLGYDEGWSAKLDFDLVYGLLMGGSTAQLSETLGRTSDEISMRWRKLNQNIGDLEHQSRLGQVLKRRAGCL